MVRSAGIAAGLILLLAACGGTAAPAPTKPAEAATVRLGTNPVSPSNGFVWVGLQQGIFAKHGVDVDVKGLGGQQRINSLVAGQIDGEVGGGPQEFVSARAEGSALTIVATFSKKFDDVLLAPAEITSVEQLRGKSIGAVTPTSVDAQGLVFYMRKFGMEPGRDYKLVGTGSSASQAGPAAAMTAHQIDAALLQEDFARGVVKQGGFHVLVDLFDTDLRLAGVPVDFRTDFIQQHPDAVQKTVDALVDCVRYTKEHPAETKAIWGKQYKMEDEERLDTIYKREVELWQKAPIPDKAAFDDVIEFVSMSNPKVKGLDPSTFIDPRFVDDAVKRGLTNY